jgi:predicted transcriptional regulator
VRVVSQESQVQVEPGNIVSTYVSDDLKAALVALARRNDRSVSAEIRIALKRHLELASEAAA